MAWEDCFEVLFMGLVVVRNYAWCLIVICHIYGIWTRQEQKCVGDALNWGGDAIYKGGTLLIEKADSHFVILTYCETLLQVLLDICCKKCYQLPLHQKCNSKCSNNINTEWAIPEKVLGFLLYPWKFQTKQGFSPRFFM